ncbi:hypothetical protein [Calothrix sp. 336/3]|uniref:hypothetical protein n=1 Tax=Calothrix sp. 336/3 TaxID=1337936 RepID=UPI000A5E0567|nr:hypothetical protein [Calothrix sp. 336/3]
MDKARTKIDELIAECLVQAGLILQEQLEYAKRQQQKSGKLLEDIFIQQGLVTKDKILYFEDIVTLPLVNHSNLEMSGDSHYHNLNYLISAKSFLKTLLKIIFFLIIAHLTTQLLQRFTHDFPLRDSFVKLFYLDGELNFPSLYSAFALLFCSLILSVIASIKKKQDDIYTIYWQGLSVIFSFLCFDELASLHERLVEPVRTTLIQKVFFTSRG